EVTMKKIPAFEPDEKKRIALLLKSVLPPSYIERRGFPAAYARMIDDLELLFKELQPDQKRPTPEEYLRHIGSDDWVLYFEIQPDSTCRRASTCRLAHENAVSTQARAAGACARVERDSRTGQFKPSTGAARIAVDF